VWGVRRALMMAATDMAKVRLLLDHGANVNTATRRGRTALLIVAMSDHSAEIVRLLAAKGADLPSSRADFPTAAINGSAHGPQVGQRWH